MRVPGNMILPDPGAKVRRNAVMKGAEAANAQPMMDVPGGKNWRAVHWDSVRERGEAPPGKIDQGVSLFRARAAHEWLSVVLIMPPRARAPGRVS